MANNDIPQDGGWDWFEAAGAPPPETPESERQLALAFARCFQGRDGEQALSYLRRTTLERALGPGASDTMLRHLEGQRQLVTHITALIQRGRNGG